MTILEFKPKQVVKELAKVVEAIDVVPANIKLDYWKERNEIISNTFCTLSPYEKQETLDIVLQINNDLYELCLKLKKGE